MKTTEIYELVANMIIEQLNAGIIPWRDPCLVTMGTPVNAATGKAYRGTNILVLSMAARWHGYNHAAWVTYKQCQQLGGRIRKGEHGQKVVFWKFPAATAATTDDADEASDALAASDDGTGPRIYRGPILRCYTVFNTEQCTGLTMPAPVAAVDNNPIQAAESIIAGMPRAPRITHTDTGMWYRRQTDTVNVPPMGHMVSSEEYYSGFFHELGHSTAHESRLNRRIDAADAATRYGREELVAELTSAFLCQRAGILPATIENSAAYIGGWLEKINEDNRMVLVAAAQAQKAADYILGVTHAA